MGIWGVDLGLLPAQIHTFWCTFGRCAQVMVCGWAGSVVGCRVLVEDPSAPRAAGWVRPRRGLYQLIALQLLRDPELDFMAVAEEIWGPGLDRKTARMRVYSGLSHLKRLGVARALGGCRYEIDQQEGRCLYGGTSHSTTRLAAPPGDQNAMGRSDGERRQRGGRMSPPLR